jgi:hypothetical protein
VQASLKLASSAGSGPTEQYSDLSAEAGRVTQIFIVKNISYDNQRYDCATKALHGTLPRATYQNSFEKSVARY